MSGMLQFCWMEEDIVIVYLCYELFVREILGRAAF